MSVTICEILHLESEKRRHHTLVYILVICWPN